MTRAWAKWMLAAWLPIGAGLGAACHSKQELPATEELCIGPFGICARLVDGRGACWGYLHFVLDAHAKRLQCATSAVRMCIENTSGQFQCWLPRTDDGGVLPLTIPSDDMLPLEHWWMDQYGLGGCGIQASGKAVCWPPEDIDGFTTYKSNSIDYRVQSLSFTDPCLVLIDTDGALHAHFETDGCGALKPTDPYDQPHDAYDLDQVPSGTNWRFVAGGRYHACALDDQGQATCWGDGPQALEAPTDVQFTELSATSGATCGITTDGHIRCWAGASWDDPWYDTGSNYWIPDDVPTSGGWAHVVMGDSSDHFACAIDTAGQVSCFGDYWPLSSLEKALDNPVDEPPAMPFY